MTHAILTGGAGFIGSHLAERLLADGLDVTIIDNYLTGNPDHVPKECRVIEADVRDPSWPRRAVRDDTAYVLHLASPASPRWYRQYPLATLETNSIGTDQAIQAALISGSRFILASTSEVYGDPEQHPQTETYNGNVSCDGPRSMYDEGKRYAEALTAIYRRKGLNAGVVRIFNTYGPRMRPDDGRVIPAFYAHALTGQPLPIEGTGNQTRSLCYVTDTVEGIWAYTQTNYQVPVNIGNPEEVTIRELATAVTKVVGAPDEVTHLPAAPDDPTRRCPNLARTEALTGWTPKISLIEGLTRTFNSLETP